MDITDRIARIAQRWADSYGYTIAEAIVAELELTESDAKKTPPACEARYLCPECGRRDWRFFDEIGLCPCGVAMDHITGQLGRLIWDDLTVTYAPQMEN